MLHQKMSEEAYAKAIKEAMGGEVKEYAEKISWLKDRWKTKTDSLESRLMGPIVFYDTSPLYTSLIADNLSYFQKVYDKEKTKVNSSEILIKACLCGSQKVAEHLMNEQNVSYLTPDPDYGYLLGSISASNNIDWIKSTSTLMAQNGIKTSDINLLTPNYETYQIIAEIFETKPKDNANSDEKCKSETKRPSSSQ